MVYAEFKLKTRNRANKARINPDDREPKSHGRVFFMRGKVRRESEDLQK